MNNLDKGIIWTGFNKSWIMLDKVTNKWKVTSLSSETPLLTLANEVIFLTFYHYNTDLMQKDLATGIAQWNIPDEICGDDSFKRTLFLNSCNFTEFACYDGDCVPMEYR